MLDATSLELLRREYDSPYHQIPFIEDGLTYKNVGCSDLIQVKVTILPSQNLAIYFAGEGCQLTISSASLMCRHTHNKPYHKILILIEKVQTSLSSGTSSGLPKDLRYLTLFYHKPNRKQCVSLPWESLQKELNLLVDNFAIKRSLS